MGKIYKIGSKVAVNVADLVIEISPMTFEQKAQVQQTLVTGDIMAALTATKLAVKFGLKSIKGLEDEDGNEYSLEMDSEGVSDSSLDDIFNIQESGDIATVCMELLRGIPKSFVHPETGKPLKGVSFVKKASAGKK